MEEIKVIPIEDLQYLNELRIDAYPAFTTPSKREEMLERLHTIQTKHPYPFYGYYREGQLLGAMRLFDFTMNLYGQRKLVGGLASVAVHLLHKKERIAKKMVEFFLYYYRNKGASFTFLYAFRPDFYKKMGFGFGTRTYNYEVSPSTFPKGNTKEHLTFLTEEDADSLVACQHRITDKTHGMIAKTNEDYKLALKDPHRKCVGYQKDGQTKGYLIYSPQKGDKNNELTHHLIIHDWLYENTEVLDEFSTFLHSQADQFEHILFQTQDDEFYYLLDDPRNSSNRLIPGLFHESHSVGLGMMPRVVNPLQSIEEIQQRTFGNASLIVQFHIKDEFLDEVSDVVISFENRVATPSSLPPEVTVNIDIANYSSLLFGAISFKSLHNLGLITLSNSMYTNRLVELFSENTKPTCTLSF